MIINNANYVLNNISVNSVFSPDPNQNHIFVEYHLSKFFGIVVSNIILDDDTVLSILFHHITFFINLILDCNRNFSKRY